MLLPIARRENLVVRELPGETLVYDLKQNKAHCLNRSAALVFCHCDGQTTLAELAAVLRRELGVPDVDAAVRLALEQLSRRGLLEQAVPRPEEGERRSRRAALRKLTAVLGAVPLVLSLTTRHASAAVSLRVVGGAISCNPGGNLCLLGLQSLVAGVPTGPCTPVAFAPTTTVCAAGAKCDGAGNCVAQVVACVDDAQCAGFGTLCPKGAHCVGAAGAKQCVCK
ncbi:MAG TPA: PqqD family protein [Gemmataceae bacterium]|nr:PqqD family protein [Gemmataceae bacterium]